MADETKDLSKSEQLAVLVRYIDKDNKINERALTLHHLKDCSADTVSKTIVSALTNEGLDLNFCVGQCYDGANVMSGLTGGVQAKLKEHAPNATYLHCHAHRLNLVLVHTLQGNDEIEDFFSTVQKLYNFISNSSTHHELFVSAQERLSMPVLHLERTVPTRWFYWYSSVKKVRQTFQAILIVLDEGKKDRSESLGPSVQIQQSSFIFYLHAMENILGTTHILSEQLQENDLDLSAAVTLIEATCKRLVDARTDEEFNKILVKAKSSSEKCGIEWSKEKTKKRKTAIPMKFQSDLVYSTVGQNQRDASTSEEDHPEIKRVYFEIIDQIISEFDRHFTNSDFVYLAAKCFKKDSESFLEYDKLKPFLDYYDQFLDLDVIQLQLPLAKEHVSSVCLEDSVLSFLNTLKVLPVVYSEVIKVLQLFVTLPITTAGNERFFSVMKRVKNFLRTTTSDERLCSLMLMTVEREEVRNLDLDQLVNDFAALRSRRYPLLH